MERIVLGYDGTPASVSALHWVATRAAREVAAVDVVTVLPRFARDRETALVQLSDAETHLREHAPGVGVELHRLEGRAIDALTTIGPCDLLVIGVNTGHLVQSLAAGATPLKISIGSRAPVVLVPSAWRDSDEPITAGVAADDSSREALAFAAAESDGTGLALRLVHAWPMPLPLPLPGSTGLAVELEEAMTAHRGALDAAGRRVVSAFPHLDITRELVQDDAASALLRYASRSSLLVIGTHRRGIVDGALLGSVAQRILWRITCPLAIVGADESRGGTS